MKNRPGAPQNSTPSAPAAGPQPKPPAEPLPRRAAEQALERALLESEARFRAIASNVPGMVFQFQLREDGSMGFPYASEGCFALLGLNADSLQDSAQGFLDVIVEEEREPWIQAMRESARRLSTWNWEGRIRVAAWQDLKWINLRATPRRLPGGDLLWEGIMSNITQSRHAEMEIKRSHQQLAELSSHIQEVREQERMSAAREIHDDLGGNLAAVKMELAWLSRRVAPEATGDVAEKLRSLDTLIDDSISAIHRIAEHLRPPMLELGLIAAIEWYAADFARRTGATTRVACPEDDIELSQDQTIAVFRIFQEALTNIAKHASASHVAVRVELRAGNLFLTVTDDGCGIHDGDMSKPKSFGLRGMHERASALHGTLTVMRAGTRGTSVTLAIPNVG